MVGRTGPVSRGFRLRRPTRLREAASPYRSWMTDRFKSNPTKSCFVPRHLDRRSDSRDRSSKFATHPPSHLPFKNQQSSFDIRSNHWNPMVGRTGPVSRGFRLRRPTRLRGAASPYRSWMTERFKPNPTKSCFVPGHSGRRSENATHPPSHLPFKNQQYSFDIRSNHWNPMVGRTGPVSRGFRLRRPTRLREAASPYRSWMTERFKSNPTKSCLVPRHLDRRTEIEVRKSPALRSHLFHSTIRNPQSSFVNPTTAHRSPLTDPSPAQPVQRTLHSQRSHSFGHMGVDLRRFDIRMTQ